MLRSKERRYQTMKKGFFITGTDTDVGKTFVTAGIVHQLRQQKMNAIPYKSVQSGAVFENGELVPTDITQVLNIAEVDADWREFCSYQFKTAVSPHLAADLEGVTILREKILVDFRSLEQKYDCVVAEGSGGVGVPIARDYFMYDLMKDLALPVIVVAKTGVGTINHTLLTVEFLRQKEVEVAGIIFNQYTGESYEDDNIKVIEELTKVPTFGVVHKLETNDLHELREHFHKQLDGRILNRLLEGESVYV